jgi:hypothetical protein
MATKKKNTKRASPKPKKKVKSVAKVAKKVAPAKSARKKKTAPKKRPGASPVLKAKTKSLAKAARPAVAVKTAGGNSGIRSRGKREIIDTVDFQPEDVGPRSAGQSGDLQGISNVESADSESVDELLEEGNAFEATLIKGIQDAPDPDESEVTTHEVPEDDVPGEYDDEESPGRP